MTNKQSAGVFRNDHVSLCYSCTVCSCEWIRAGKPVPGWDAVPSRQAQHADKGGWQVLGCPKFDPMQDRKPRRRRRCETPPKPNT